MLRRATRAPCVLRATTLLVAMAQVLTRAALSVLRRAILTLLLVKLGVSCVPQATTLLTVMQQALTRAATSVKPMRVTRAVNLAAEATIARAPVMQATMALRVRSRLLVV